MIERHPTAAENLINMFIFFDDLNLKGIWDYRKDLVIAMANRNINIENNSLDKNELLLFGKDILVLIKNILEQDGENNDRTNNINTNPTTLPSLKYELSKFSESREL